jgi:hypothetical protein
MSQILGDLVLQERDSYSKSEPFTLASLSFQFEEWAHLLPLHLAPKFETSTQSQ